MCGIAGKIDWDWQRMRSNRGCVSEMLSSMSWRGPDARGIWEEGPISLGHLRLSIIDPSSEANQPMVDAFGNVIVFNGEIYNYQSLRSELSSIYTFKTKGDTEVILAAYAKWGPDCVSRFNGEWAFAIFDKSKNCLFLSRDRFGIKPLYYTIKGKSFIFASEIRALLAAGMPAEMTISKLAEFLKFRQIEQRYQTHLENIFPLEPGKNLIIDLHTRKREETFFYEVSDLFSADVPKCEKEAMEMFGGLLQDAVRLRMHADVPVHVLLSGGLDSSAIVGSAVRSAKSEVKTLSCVFPGSENDESYYSDMVAQYLGTRHSKCQVDNKLFFKIFDEVLVAQDFPTCSEKHVARYLLYKEAAKYSKVVLEGQGGDEVFGGYGAMYTLYRDHYQRDSGAELVMLAPEKDRKSNMKHFAELHPDVRSNIKTVKKRIETLDTDDPYRKRQFSILRNNLLGLLHTGDRLQMYHSIEGRYPLLDHRIVEMGMALPVNLKTREYDKWLLREYSKKNNILPKEVIYRKDKKGFSTDLNLFLRNSSAARNHFQDQFSLGGEMLPGLFDKNALDQLLVEQYDHGIDNVRRILASYSLMKYISKNNVSFVN